jgi:siroheme decarboxylase
VNITPGIDPVDRKIVRATQGGLPLTQQPYHDVASQLGLRPEDVMARIRRMELIGIIRRIGVVPNHYALGYQSNGMSVWDVSDEEIARVGALVGQLSFVSHCYQRPRHLPDWTYNLFAMVHGHSRDEVEEKVFKIADLLGDANRGHEILYSTRILKKTGLRLAA